MRIRRRIWDFEVGLWGVGFGIQDFGFQGQWGFGVSGLGFEDFWVGMQNLMAVDSCCSRGIVEAANILLGVRGWG